MEKVINFYAPQSKEELIQAVKYAWDSIFIDTINKLCNYFYRRCFICLQNHGKCINQFIQNSINPELRNEELENLFSKLLEDGIVLNEIETIKKKIE